MAGVMQDKELQAYRDLVKPPGHFDEGFNWKTILGALFVGVIMLPAAMYMTLMIGGESLGPAARWVTVILFLEMAKRARSFLKPAEIYILMAMVIAFVGNTPVESFFWRQYIVQSDAAQSFGLDGQFPSWFAPSSAAVLDERSFFMWEWIVPLLILFITQAIGRIDSLILGYGLFRVASDIEKLPFPMAPLQASGILALSENVQSTEGWRWRVFSIGAAMGLVFGLLYAVIPIISSTFLNEPFHIFPIPWYDSSQQTQEILPATATGISFDMSFFFMGMAFPFFAVLGGFIGLLVTFILNPYLYEVGVLKVWQPGMSTVETLFANNVDFYLSFGIGLGLAVAAIGIWQVIENFRNKQAEMQQSLDSAGPDTTQPVAPVKGVTRGDIRTPIIILVYVVSSLFYILLSWMLLGDRIIYNPDGSMHYLLVVLAFFAVVYVPLISYVTARLEGLAGQVLPMPFVKEAAFIMSGFKGLEIWLLPIPLTHNYGIDTVQYRVSELVGCTFRSIWKMNTLIVPVVFIFSLLYGQFIWSLAPIPSAPYPYAMQLWDLNARNQMLVYSSTNVGYSPFMSALRIEYIAAGLGAGLVTYFSLASFGLPILLLYGVVKGLGQTMPQFVVTQMLGALFGRYVMAKRFGVETWRKYSPVLAAGFFCGFGLSSMFGTGVKFLASSVFQLPF